MNTEGKGKSLPQRLQSIASARECRAISQGMDGQHCPMLL